MPSVFSCPLLFRQRMALDPEWVKWSKSLCEVCWLQLFHGLSLRTESTVIVCLWKGVWEGEMRVICLRKKVCGRKNQGMMMSPFFERHELSSSVVRYSRKELMPLDTRKENARKRGELMLCFLPLPVVSSFFSYNFASLVTSLGYNLGIQFSASLIPVCLSCGNCQEGRRCQPQLRPSWREAHDDYLE